MLDNIQPAAPPTMLDKSKIEQEIRIIIAGSRDFNNYNLVLDTLNTYLKNIDMSKTKVVIVSGTARGADKLGELYAERHYLECKRFPADWTNLGNKAGPKRNIQMAEYSINNGCKGVLFAFWNGFSTGTEHMINTANTKGLEVHIIRY